MQKKHFWLPISSWNIPELFITESISPNRYYKKRKFGNSNNLITDDNGIPLQAENCLVLYPNQFRFTPKIGKPAFIYIHQSAINEDFLIIDKDGIGYYFDTIFLRYGNFQLRFFNENDKKMFMANTSVSLEAKTFNKYNLDFFKEQKQNILFVGKEPSIVNNHKINLLVTNQDKGRNWAFDKAYNQIKGFVYGFLCGTIGKKSGNEVELETELQKLKNKVNALRTFFEMSESYSKEIFEVTLKLTEQCEKIFLETLPNNANHNFIGIKKRIKDLQNLQPLKLAELKNQKNNSRKSGTGKIKEELDLLYKKKTILKNQQEKLREEKRNLNELAKSIKRPKKDSEEYERKQELKYEIQEIQDEINNISSTLKPINKEIRNLNNDFGEFKSFGRTQYDGNIEEQFYKITSSINNLIFASNSEVADKQRKSDLPNLSGFDFDINRLAEKYEGKIEQENFIDSIDSIHFDMLSKNDKELLTIILNTVFLNPSEFSGDVSESLINQILEEVLNKSKKLEDKEIVNSLSDLFNYRMTREGNYQIPDFSITLQNFFSFIIKPTNPEELKKIIYSKGIREFHIAYAIWGAFVGFAAMPKTFTNIVFDSEDKNIFEQIDDYLFSKFLNNKRMKTDDNKA